MQVMELAGHALHGVAIAIDEPCRVCRFRGRSRRRWSELRLVELSK
jgi:hypothetical protein